ncbi:hypothetical protein AVEN_243335-1 [Araneus ventricosus]|uniref:Uncharacterized protein n=1 Tax=Araneus ventricosus TaxID=182803 RepID=A0A4Y2NJK0_ARAVE|nr:hypothetical protein AVEN_243335-1 [Araneus ventricosus]
MWSDNETGLRRVNSGCSRKPSNPVFRPRNQRRRRATFNEVDGRKVTLRVDHKPITYGQPECTYFSARLQERRYLRIPLLRELHSWLLNFLTTLREKYRRKLK